MSTTFCKVPTGAAGSALLVKFHQRRTIIEETSLTVKMNKKSGVMRWRCFRAYPQPSSNEIPRIRRLKTEELQKKSLYGGAYRETNQRPLAFLEPKIHVSVHRVPSNPSEDPTHLSTDPLLGII